MFLRALLVSKDDTAAETLVQVLVEFGIAVARSNAAEVAVARLTEERFDTVVVDFDDPDTASLMLESCRHPAGPDRNPPLTVALLPDAARIRAILGAGAHFILVKPVSHEQAQTTLRAATALLKRERRKSVRVDLQVPVSIHTQETTMEGIALGLSTSGMDVLSAKPLPSAGRVHVSFELPNGSASIEADAEVVWSEGNGQTGLRFLDVEANAREKVQAWLGARSQDAVPEEAETPSPCKLTDLSLGGCYVETESPLPQGSAVDLCLRVAGVEIHAEGLVRVMHPGHGMGIEFPARTELQRHSVGEFIGCLSSQPGAQPQLETSPRSLVASNAALSHTASADGDVEDPLLELLRSGSGMEQEEFLAELASQRTRVENSPETVS